MQNIHMTDDSLELSKMFHEIKNPLALISSSLQLIESDHPEVRSFRFWNQTTKDLSALCSLVNDLSSFQKGNLLKMTKIDLFDFTEDLSEAMEAFLLETGTPLIVESSVSDLDFYADAIKLRQAVINLLKNAAESSENDSPIVLRITSDQSRLFLSVIDKGPGISSEQMSHIYEPFHTTKPNGSGLGLPIAKRIIYAHGGTMTISSQEGAGTVVFISLPLS